MAADGISGEVLWSRRIDSDIASIYGIGKRSKWVSLETFDVTSDLGISTSISARSDGISPFGYRNNMESHRIGRHGSHSYVITKFDVGSNPLQLSSSDVDPKILDNPGSLQLVTHRDYGTHPPKDDYFIPSTRNLSSMSSLKRIGRLIPYGAGQVESRNQLHRLGGHDSLLYVNPTNMNNPDFRHSMEVAHRYHAGKDLFSMTPLDMSMISVRRPPPSHRTEHGLYLTWSMVAAVIMILLSVIVFFARLIILRQKRKWERTPNLSQNATKSSDDVNSNGGFIPLQAQTLNSPSLGSVNSWPKKYLPVTRSFSLGAIRTHSFSNRPIITERGRSDQNEDCSTIPGASTPAISPNTANSKAIPSDDSKDKSKPSVDNIDGIPLVRYSRYTSEFNEILALGRGGFGTVFRCRNVLDGREYAIKKIKITSPVSGNVTKHLSQKLHRVLREVKCLALLDHPNIVRYYTAWLEVDNGVHGDDDETNTISSMFDRNSLVTGFESFSRAMQQSFLPKRNKRQRPAKELKELSNPLGWNNFGSLRLDESKSEALLSVGTRLADTTKAVSVHDDEDDLGFIWEQSKDDSVEPSLSAENQPLEKHDVDDKHSSPAIGVADTIESENGPVAQTNNEDEKSVQLLQAPTDTSYNVKTSVGRHILFIQMQLCSVQTLADFLANHEARGGVVSQSYAVDIPLAIRLFAQIAHGVKYVHKQGLIHRDLKPQVSSLFHIRPSTHCTCLIVCAIV
jgi:serine/threonine protein kinase